MDKDKIIYHVKYSAYFIMAVKKYAEYLTSYLILQILKPISVSMIQTTYERHHAKMFLQGFWTR